MIIEKEYRGMAFTTEEQEKDLGYSVILKYYREKRRLIDRSEVYAMNIKIKVFYKEDEDFVKEYEESAIISTNKDVANQIIEIFRMNQVCPETLQEVYEDLTTERKKLD